MIYILAMHPIIVWFTFMVGIITLISLASSARQAHIDYALLSTFVVFIDMQSLLGIMRSVWGESMQVGFPDYPIMRGVAMLIAAAIGHSLLSWRKSDLKIQVCIYALTVLTALVLVVISAAVFPRGWEGPRF